MTDAVKLIAENTAKFSGGTHLTKRYFDMANDEKPEKERSAEEIIAEVTENAGLEAIDDG